ncbi:MAG TPA: site-2 protease family protein [Actinomycetota bacterium]|jgi:Zn-dependent protease|nr:site-2 protease family protein [Actinomycetota bacterium]
MIERDIRLGTIAGIEVGLNWSLLVVFWLITWSLASSVFPELYPGQGTTAYWITAVIAAVVFFGSLLAHELGHALLARRKGVTVDGITLWLFGGVARLRGETMDPSAELRITAIGPGISLVAAAAFGLVALGLNALGAPELVVGVPAWLGIINASLAVFNLLPAFPLDGGRVLRAWLWRRRDDRISATRTAAAVGRVFGYGLIGLGLLEFALVASIGGLWFVFLGWFLLGAARAEESQTLLRAALRDVRVHHIMSPDPVAVPATLSVRSFVEDHAMTQRFTSFPVDDEAGRTVGLVTLGRVKAVPPDRRDRTTVGDIACPLEEVATVSPDDPATTLLERLQECEDGRALVLEGGRVVGIVSPRDVHRALELAGLRAGTVRLPGG